MLSSKSSPSRYFKLKFGFLLHLMILVTGTNAEIVANKFEIPRSTVHIVQDEKSDRAYQIYVRTPRGYDKNYNKTKIYPVIYLNDAPYTFQIASGITHIPSFDKEYESVILVGISYAVGEKPRASRTWDLTPSNDSSWKTYSGYNSGGAAQYLEFLEKGLMPFVENHYRIDASKRSLAGHSFGGLFAAWVMFTKPEMFDNYIISSPSLWFDKKRMFKVEKEYAAANNDLRVNAYFGTGQLEQMHDDLTADHIAFVKQLRNRNYAGLNLQSLILEDIDHTTAFPINFTRAMRWIFHSLKK